MTNDISLFKKKLEAERATLIGELKGVGVIKNDKNPDDWEATPADIDTSRSDPNEVSDRIEAYEENTALVHDLEGQLAETDAALQRIKDGSYGACEVCGKPIEQDRLEANPSARTCKEHMK